MTKWVVEHFAEAERLRKQALVDAERQQTVEQVVARRDRIEHLSRTAARLLGHGGSGVY